MIETPRAEDRVLRRIAALSNEGPAPELSAKIRAAALVRLRPRPLHPVWALLVAGSTVGYLAGALKFTLALF